MNPWDIVYALKSTRSRKEKQAILSKVTPDNDFWPGARLAYESSITFGVKKLPDVKPSGRGVRFSEFVSLTDKLASRELSGHAALDAIAEFASRCHENEWTYWYSLILQKDMECGANKIISDAAPNEYKFEEFPFQGAIPLKDVSDDRIPEDAFVETKYDGVRTFWFLKPHQEVICLSRKGKELFNFGQIADVLRGVRDTEGFPEEGLVIDGEVVSETFNSVMKELKRKKDVNFKGHFLAFDVLDMETFWKRGPNAPLKTRRQILEEVISMAKDHDPHDVVGLSEYIRVNARRDNDEVMNFYNLRVEAGFEGIIIKDANSPYHYKKDHTWIKLKPSDTWDLEVIDVIEGTGRLIGSMGALLCQGRDGDKVIVSHVGSGFSDTLRAEIWTNREEVKGQIVEIKGDTLSKSDNSETFSIRFPVFVRFRDDKRAEN